MNRSQQIRAMLGALLILLSIVLLIPTFKAASISSADRAAAAKDPALKEQIAKTDAKAIRLGLDLQGGMYLVLDVDQKGLTGDQAQDALKRVVEIIRNRVDQFGISEPVIQTQGTGRIIVELPGMQDPERAKNLIGRTARLEFRLVRPPEEVASVLARLDEAFKAAAAHAPAATDTAAARLDPAGATKVAAAAKDTSASPFKELPPLPTGGGEKEDEAFVKDHPFSAYVTDDEAVAGRYGTPLFVDEADVPRIEQMLASPAAKAIPVGVELMLGSKVETASGGQRGRPLFLLNSVASLTGDRLTGARSAPDSEKPGSWQVDMSFDRMGARQFSKVTGENVGRNLAITLDGRVDSAPNIRTKIPSGRAQITGTFTNQEASDLALLLRAGALPASVHVEEERTIGPGLGRDSIHQGVTAAWIGILAVVLFTIFYYRLTGFIAVLSLVANALILMAILAQFGLVLTLPGIAGVVLTIGMGVDANVLINERIREELRKSKTVRAAVDAGFHNAARTIIDSHVTTLASCVILLWFGTGPIKGYAVTLSIGIFVNLFTALIMTRFFMEALASDPTRTRLSI